MLGRQQRKLWIRLKIAKRDKLHYAQPAWMPRFSKRGGMIGAASTLVLMLVKTVEIQNNLQKSKNQAANNIFEDFSSYKKHKDKAR